MWFCFSTFERELRKALALARRGRVKLPPLPARQRVSAATLVVHAPVDVAHWLPNMPRGSESRRRGGVRDKNAGGGRIGNLIPALLR